MGMASRISARWGEANRKYMAIQREASDVAGGLGSISKIFRMVLQSGVLAVGAWLVINRAGDRRHHHRGLDPVRARARAGRSRHRQLEKLRRRAPELEAADAAARLLPGARRADGAGSAAEFDRGRRGQRDAARRPEDRRAGHPVHAAGRQRARHHRAERIGEILPGAAPGRRLAAGARENPARRRRARPMDAGNAWAPYRLSAAGRRTAERQYRAEHRPLRGGRRTPKTCSPPRNRPACTI